MGARLGAWPVAVRRMSAAGHPITTATTKRAVGLTSRRLFIVPCATIEGWCSYAENPAGRLRQARWCA